MSGQSDTPETDRLMARWDDDGATRGPAFIELRDMCRDYEKNFRKYVLNKKFVPLRDYTTLERECAALREDKDGAYFERNQCVAALTKLFPSTRTKTAIEGWMEDWHGCVYIDLPTGQVSWHFHDSQAYLFQHVQEADTRWDGHDTPEKYRRLAAIDAAMQEAK